MSNSVSLFVATPEELAREFASYSTSPGKGFTFKNYLDEFDSDTFASEVAEFYQSAGRLVEPFDTFARIVLWSWLDDAPRPRLDPPSGMTEQSLGFDLAIGPRAIEAMRKVIDSLEPVAMVNSLKQSGATEDDAAFLKQYWNCWIRAFQEALAQSKGVYYIVWV